MSRTFLVPELIWFRSVKLFEHQALGWIALGEVRQHFDLFGIRPLDMADFKDTLGFLGLFIVLALLAPFSWMQ